MIRGISSKSLKRTTDILAHTGLEASPAHSRKLNLPASRGIQANTTSHRFHFSNFRYSLTLFSKFFASFPHGTCSLSVSHLYLALDGIYHPLRAAIPNNSTRWKPIVHSTQLGWTGLSPSKALYSKRFSKLFELIRLLQSTIPKIFTLSCSRFTRRYWGNPC
jgi:hypothetical protein